jgi:cobalt-zinc-cadmium efflux system membrane fusion protein
VVRLAGWIAAGALVCVASASAGAPPAGPVFVPVARSALVTVEGAVAARTLLLRVRSARDQQPLTGAELSVTVDGRSAAAAVRPDGAWTVTLADPARSASGTLEIVVAHDGVREVLDGRIPHADAPPAGGAAAAGGGSAGLVSTLMHKQAAWWVLNVLIVLIGVIVISRRMS